MDFPESLSMVAVQFFRDFKLAEQETPMVAGPSGCLLTRYPSKLTEILTSSTKLDTGFGGAQIGTKA
jgi:hypothetical protein